MIKLKHIIYEDIRGYSNKRVTGLAHAKVGDYIEIGVEGTRVKRQTKISKVVTNDRLMDVSGNIFNRNGIIFRRKSNWLKYINKNAKIISARQITYKEYKKSVLGFVERNLNNYKWSKLSIDDLLEISKIIKLGFPQLEALSKS